MKLIELPYDHFIVVDPNSPIDVDDYCYDYDYKEIVRASRYNKEKPNNIFLITHSTAQLDGTCPLDLSEILNIFKGNNLNDTQHEWEITFNEQSRIQLLELNPNTPIHDTRDSSSDETQYPTI